MKIRLGSPTDRIYFEGLVQEASEDSGIPLETLKPHTSAEGMRRILIAWDGLKPLGYLAFMVAVNPDTSEKVLVERMLYVGKAHRGSMCAVRLLKAAEEIAIQAGCEAILAGSSLKCNDIAQRLYESRGFTTNLTFRKDIKCVTL